MAKVTRNKIEAVQRYQNNNIRRFVVKLNINTQPDLIEYLEEQKSMQGTIIKALQEYRNKRYTSEILITALEIVSDQLAERNPNFQASEIFEELIAEAENRLNIE